MKNEVCEIPDLLPSRQQRRWETPPKPEIKILLQSEALPLSLYGLFERPHLESNQGPSDGLFCLIRSADKEIIKRSTWPLSIVCHYMFII
jgi:hypothetical protein